MIGWMRVLLSGRDILITPKRISYAREKEKELFESLVGLTNSKQSEIQRLILQAVDEMQEVLIDQACSLEIAGRRGASPSKKQPSRMWHFFPGIELTDQLTVKTAKDLKRCTSTIQEFVLVRLNQAIAERLSSSVSILHQDYVGTLTRCLDNLELSKDEDESSASASQALQEVIF